MVFLMLLSYCLRKFGLVFVALLLFLIFGLSFNSDLAAVESAPSKVQIADAINLGLRMKDAPEKLFEPYEFGKRGVETNGYVMTKLFQISQRAAMFAREGKKIENDSFADILKQDYLLFPVYLLAASEKGLENVSVELRQGLKTIKASKVIQDPIEKMMCQKDACIYKRDLYAGFYYTDFDPLRLAVLVVRSGKKKIEFSLSLSTYK